MEADYDISNIDANLDADIIAHRKKNEKQFVCFLIIMVIIFRGWFSYWLRFGVAIPARMTNAPIDVKLDPIQQNYSEIEQKQKTFVYQSLINKNKVTIIPQAYYKMSGTVVAYNRSFVFTNNFFDSAALYDLGTAWGKMGDKKFYSKYFTCYSQKNEIYGSRILWTKYKVYPAPVSLEYSISHFSHSHIVPANRNIMAALLKIKVWDKVIIEGELIDMTAENWHYHTSMSRTDIDFGDRGNGSCESIYVTSVQIGRKVYK